MDLAGEGALPGWLAYVHPAWMIVALGLAWLALRSGLELRRLRRLARADGLVELRTRHLRRAKSAIALLVVGFALGPASAFWLRDMAPFRTLHAWVGVAALALFVAAAIFGHRLEEGERGVAPLHARLALAALLVSALAFATGFVLLP